jgi:Tfp pilus assembly protein PilV
MKNMKKGFGLIEIIVTTAVVGTTVILLMGVIQDSVLVARLSLERAKAAFLLEEGAESVRVIRDNSWTGISSLTVNTPYYLLWNGTIWTTSSTPNQIDMFTRTITISDVYRDGNNDISSSGTLDVGTKLVTINVSWNSSSGTQTETLQFYITNTFD